MVNHEKFCPYCSDRGLNRNRDKYLAVAFATKLGVDLIGHFP